MSHEHRLNLINLAMSLKSRLHLHCLRRNWFLAFASILSFLIYSFSMPYLHSAYSCSGGSCTIQVWASHVSIFLQLNINFGAFLLTWASISENFYLSIFFHLSIWIWAYFFTWAFLSEHIFLPEHDIWTLLFNWALASLHFFQAEHF